MNAMEAPDERLMELAAAGDDSALETLMRRYHHPLLSFIARQTDEDPEDIYQETWLRIVRSGKRFDPSKKFSTWLFQIAVNLCRDAHRRSAARVQETELQAAAGETNPEPDGQAQAALEALRSLPAADRELIALRYYQGFSEKEVADILGVPLGTVKRRTHDAVKRLKTEVERQKQ